MTRFIDSTLFINAIRLKTSRVDSFERYPFNVPAIRHLNDIRIDAPVTMFVGENGSGKSTLLEAIASAWGFNPEGGTINFRFSTRDSHSELENCIVLERGVKRPRDGFFLRAESFFNVATQIEALGVINSYGGKSLHEQSHGESFMALVLNRFGGKGLYILDEPEAALSPNRQLALLVRMHDLVRDGSQFLIATHSPLLLAYPGATIRSLDTEGIPAVEYEDTDHYQVTRRFLLDHKRALSELLQSNANETGVDHE